MRTWEILVALAQITHHLLEERMLDMKLLITNSGKMGKPEDFLAALPYSWKA